jgi:ribosomal protein S18 acetylase RimI-like enzyme
MAKTPAPHPPPHSPFTAPPHGVRPFRPEDREQVLALAPRLTEGVAPWRDPAGVASAATGWVTGSMARAGEPAHAVFVAELDGRVGGVITLGERPHFSGQTDAYVGELIVAAGLERRGIATELMRAAEAWARRQGYAFITLDTGAANDPARKLYAALGFLEEEVRLTKAVRPE